ncbi:uncharacterized protein LOC6551093 [Drosophila erecta]|uniref:Uncharacterized protein n=1 Tax=Drosophila erecta TaxID=7220 RepID=B3NUB9_DROER|nr:uncharacterized protein LOC6551093 [Drosophila erecta]EDV46034.1 uncharacterized protein Dere_GG18849 [Drosophila erecta]
MEPAESPEKLMKSVRRSDVLENVGCISVGDLSHGDLSDIDLKDVPAQLEATLKPRRYEASTLFNIDLDEIWEPSCQENDVQQFKERAQKEQQKFFDFVMHAALDTDNRKVNYQPNKEQQRHLDQGPNLQNFVRGSLAFTNAAIRFQAEHEEMMDLHFNLEDHYIFMRNTMINNAVHQNLAGQRRS